MSSIFLVIGGWGMVISDWGLVNGCRLLITIQHSLFPEIRHTFQLDGNGHGQGVYFYGSATRLVVFKIFGVNAVERVEIALHVYEEYGDIGQLFPFGATGFQYTSYVPESAVNLYFKIETGEIAFFIVLLSGYSAAIGVTRADSRQVQEIACFTGMRVKSNRFGGIIGGYGLGHKKGFNCKVIGFWMKTAPDDTV
jgi:hypothetical protein